jgi:hypothetical protein
MNLFTESQLQDIVSLIQKEKPLYINVIKRFCLCIKFRICLI